MNKKIKLGKKYRSKIDGKIIKITRIEDKIFYSTDEDSIKEKPSPNRFIDYFQLLNETT